MGALADTAPADLVTGPEQITPAWLTRRLRRSGHLPAGEVLAIEPGKRFQNRAGFFICFRASYSVAPAPTLYEQLILRLCPGHRVGDALADLNFFAEFTDGIADPPVPRHYDHLAAPDRSCAHFLMEDLNATHRSIARRDAKRRGPAPRGERYPLQDYADLVEGLLKFHIRWWDDPRLEAADLRRRAHGPIDLAQAAAPAEVRRRSAAIGRDLAAFRVKYAGAVVAEHYDLAQRVCDAWPRLFGARVKTGRALTLVHGDYHFGNVFLPNPPLSETVAILDWECAMKGLGVSDLAYLLVHSHHSDKRREFEMPYLRLYHNNLGYHGIEDYDWEQCLYDYRLSVLAQLFVPLRWDSPRDFKRPIAAIRDWDCEELL